MATVRRTFGGNEGKRKSLRRRKSKAGFVVTRRTAGNPEQVRIPSNRRQTKGESNCKEDRDDRTRSHFSHLLLSPKSGNKREAHSINEIARFHMLLVPRPPEFATYAEDGNRQAEADEDMNVLMQFLLTRVERNTMERHYRLVSIGKKRLPDPSGPGSCRRETFWGTDCGWR